MAVQTLSLSSCLALTVLLSGCGAAPWLHATGPETAVAASSVPEEAPTVEAEIGSVTLGLLPNNDMRAHAASAQDEAPSYETEHGLLGPQILGQTLPSQVDLRPYCSPIRNQGHLGSCTAFATTGMMEAMMNLQGHDAQLSKIGHLSTLFFYAMERKTMEDTGYRAHATKKDTGAPLAIAIKTAVKVGAPPEATVPYQDGRPALAYDVTAADTQAARPYRATGYARISTLQGMKSALASKHPFLMGLPCYPSFLTKTVARTGEMPLPTHGETPKGGHALCCVGYDDAKGAFIVRNSWGEDWGQKGYFYMPYDFFKPTWTGFRYYFSCYTLD